MMLNTYLGTGFFVLMFLAEEIYPCSIHICFKWRISLNRLTLTCKVDDLHLSIFISDPYGKIQADCTQPYPFVRCASYYKNGSITQNSTTQETIFYVQGKIDKSINGNWTCRHGYRKDIARAEVTVLNIADGLGSGLNVDYANNTAILSRNQCLYKVLISSMTAYFGVMLVWILLWCKAGDYIKPWVDDIWQNCMCINSIQVCKSASFFICTCLFIGICVLCGIIDDATCISRIILPIIGVLLGSICTPLFLNLAVVKSNMIETRGTALGRQANDCVEEHSFSMLEEVPR